MKFFKILALVLIMQIIGIAKGSDDRFAFNNIAPKLYLDCNYCDYNHIRENITFINYVIERKEADIHLLVTRERTASGGAKYSFYFLGQNEFKSKNDTLFLSVHDNEAWDNTRQKMVNTIKLGLIPYISKSLIAQDINVSYKESKSPVKVNDNWNYWVIRTRVDGNFNGEESSGAQRYGLRVATDRITEEWKIRADVEYDFNKNIEKLDNETLIVKKKDIEFDFLLVKSLNNHWSTGMFLEANSDTYSNMKVGYSFSPAIEYNIFPYSEASRKEFSIRYALGYENFSYRDTTIYNKIKESLLKQSLRMDIRFNQPWGEVNFFLYGSNYIPIMSKNRLSINNRISLNLFKGLSFNIRGGASIIHDQLSLEKGEVSLTERLLNIKEIETSYSYWFGVGLEYTFGSIYNNIVNPRF